MDESMLVTLLNRAGCSVKQLDQLLNHIEADYPIGKMERFEPIGEGYEDANIRIWTTEGDYVLKLFLKDRSDENVRDYVRVLTEAKLAGVPVPELVTGPSQGMRFILTKFFEGDNFCRVSPTDPDVVQVTRFLARLQTLNFPIAECYDSWGNKNLVAEYDRYSQQVGEEVKKWVKPVVEECRKLRLTELPRAVIHGDLQRKHVLKNAGGYCLLDFGCMSNAARVFELSTFLAWFCLDPDTWDQETRWRQLAVDTYEETWLLTEYEKAILPLLTMAAYASYYFKTSLLQQAGDRSQETAEWHEVAEHMLKQTTENWK